MSRGNRIRLARNRAVLLSVTGAGTILLISGCTDVRRAVGLERTSPDEFAVETRAPLTIPPEYDLRPPQPGAPRPQEGNAAERARRIVDAAGPGEPGKQAGAGGPPPVNGTQAPDPNQQVAEQGLASKLLGYSDPGTGAAVEKRETSTLKSVY